MMVEIELQRSGGFMGRSASAQDRFDIDEALLLAKLKSASRDPNPMARDDFYYTLLINGKPYDVDPGKLKGDLRKIFNKLEDKLELNP